MKPMYKPQGETRAHFLGKNKSTIIKELMEHHATYCQFAGWLFIPTWGMVLSFDKQVCCQVGKI